MREVKGSKKCNIILLHKSYKTTTHTSHHRSFYGGNRLGRRTNITRRCFFVQRMESSSLRKSSYHMKREKREREKLVSRVISPAIRGQKCPICLDNLTDRRAAVLKVCTHAYCLVCIETWSNLKRNCPLCNTPFHSWFYRINLSCSNFLQQQLQPLIKDKTFVSQSHSSPRTPHRSAQIFFFSFFLVNC